MNLYWFVKNKFFYSAITLIVLLQFILAFQGFDICDDGFVLTFYQQIFSNPESVEYNFLYWFAGVFGGVWYQLFPEGGVFWFRILGILVNTLTFIIVYRLLKTYVSSYFLVFGLAMVLFVNDYGFLTFYHNHLTALLAFLSVYLIYKGLTKSSWFLLLLSGFVIGINVFTRLPNLVLFILVLAIPFYQYLQKKPLVKSLKPIACFTFGALLAFVTIYLLLLFLGQLEIMKNAIVVLDDLSATEESVHNFSDVIWAQWYNYKAIIKASLVLLMPLSIYFFIMPKLKTNYVFKYLVFMLLAIFFIFWINEFAIFSIYSLALFGSFFTAINTKDAKALRTLGFMSLLILLTLSLGTGGGILNSGYMIIWLGLPLFFRASLRINDFSNMVSKFKNYKLWLYQEGFMKNALIVLIIAFFILKSYKIFNEAYFDEGSRLYKTTAIKNPKAKYIYTTKKRGKIINSILKELDKHVKPNDYLLTYSHIPMLHFLTETKPYAYNPWVGIYDKNSFDKKLKKAEIEIEKLPIVVQQKFNTIISFSAPIEDYMSTQKENSLHHNNSMNAVMNHFLERNKYEIIWSNSYFNIYKSSVDKKAIHMLPRTDTN